MRDERDVRLAGSRLERLEVAAAPSCEDGSAAARAPPSGKRGLAAGVIEAVRRFRLDGHAADGVGDRVVLVHGCVSLLVWRRAGGDRLIEVSGIS